MAAAAQTVALMDRLGWGDRDLVRCDLVRTELTRTVRPIGPDLMLRGLEVLDAATLVQVSTDLFEEAGRLGLRT